MIYGAYIAAFRIPGAIPDIDTRCMYQALGIITAELMTRWDG